MQTGLSAHCTHRCAHRRSACARSPCTPAPAPTCQQTVSQPCPSALVHAEPCSKPCCQQETGGVTPQAHQSQPIRHLAALSAGALLQGFLAYSAAAQETATALAEGTKYVPSPYEPGWEIWAGSIAATIPFVIGSYEFGKRIIIQQRCELCGGRGLVPSTNASSQYLRKCPQCGGFFPWVSWKLFLTSTAAPGNGGPLQQPKGQRSVFYEVPQAMPTKEQVVAARERYMAQQQDADRAGSSEVAERDESSSRVVASSKSSEDRTQS